MAKPVGCYLRVSTEDQSHDSQRGELTRWLTRHGIDPARVEWYVDTWTGRELSRPDFDRLKADVAAGRLSTVLVYKLDRLSRDLLDAMTVLSAWCKAGVRVASATEPVDVTGPFGKLLASVMIGVAEIELNNIRDRQRSGIAEARARGAYKGRKPGALKASDGRDRARELRSRGFKNHEIAKQLGVSTVTVWRYLNDPADGVPVLVKGE